MMTKYVFITFLNIRLENNNANYKSDENFLLQTEQLNSLSGKGQCTLQTSRVSDFISRNLMSPRRSSRRPITKVLLLRNLIFAVFPLSLCIFLQRGQSKRRNDDDKIYVYKFSLHMTGK